MQIVFQLSGPVCKFTRRYTSDIPPFFVLLTFISCFMIDFVSIEKVFFLISPRLLPMIVTPYGHILYTKMLHFEWRSISAILRNGGDEVYLLRTRTNA